LNQLQRGKSGFRPDFLFVRKQTYAVDDAIYAESADKEAYMSLPNSDETEGKLEQAKGWVKDKAGELTGNERLEAEGEAQRAEGKTQETWGKVKSGVGDAVKAVGDAIDD
jgi:uncharacterized protein YjbJ (UPF0337 family)